METSKDQAATGPEAVGGAGGGRRAGSREGVMNLRLLPPSSSPRPARTGLPWTDEDYESLVRLCREGHAAEPLAAALGRTPVAVLDRARRMLPPTERGLPRDLTVTRLRELLHEDPSYDWAAAMRQAPPPPPVEHRVYARRGVAGLRQQELLAVAEVLTLQPHGGEAVRAEVLRSVERLGLTEELEHRVGRVAVGRALAAVEVLDLPTSLGWDGPPEWDRPSCHDSCEPADIPDWWATEDVRDPEPPDGRWCTPVDEPPW